MSGRRLRRAAAAAALGLDATLGALTVLYGEDVPFLEHSAPSRRSPHLLRARLLSRGAARRTRRSSSRLCTTVLVGRLLVTALLAFAGATVALLAAAVPAQHGLATGLLGAAAAAALFLFVAAVARRGGEVGFAADEIERNAISLVPGAASSRASSVGTFRGFDSREGSWQGVADEHGLIGTIPVLRRPGDPGCLTGRHADVRVVW